MFIYEKEDKLNLKFNPVTTANFEDPDIVVSKKGINLGDLEISNKNILPAPEQSDSGKMVMVDEEGNYTLQTLAILADATLIIS